MHMSKPKANAALTITATIILAVIMMALVFMSVQQSQIISALSQSLNATRDQVKDSGEVPVSPPANEITSTTGIAGTKGDKGDTGDTGDTGASGPATSFEELLEVVGVYCSTITCVGSDGQVGPQGAAGMTGEVGLTGVMGERGQSGVDGQSGINGQEGPIGLTGMTGMTGLDGATGADGEPPFSWTISRALPNGSFETESCVREDPFVPETPEYVCSVSEPVTPIN